MWTFNVSACPKTDYLSSETTLWYFFSEISFPYLSCSDNPDFNQFWDGGWWGMISQAKKKSTLFYFIGVSYPMAFIAHLLLELLGKWSSLFRVTAVSKVVSQCWWSSSYSSTAMREPAWDQNGETKAEVRRDQVWWHWEPGLSLFQWKCNHHASQLCELIDSIL